jgi:4-hydroxy-2-oxoheptanedioate aldolase
MDVMPLRARLARSGYVLNGYCSMPSPAAAEIYARQGFDCVTLDLEHGSIGFDAAVSMLQAMASADVVPMVRIPAVDAAQIGMLLDSGVLGITCAMIESKAQAEALVRACRYPPKGERSLSRSTRATLLHGAAYNGNADDWIAVFAMVESPAGMRELEAIAAVEGIDGIYFGSIDYVTALLGRFPPPDRSDPEIDAAIAEASRRIVACCQSHGIVAGMNATSAEAAGKRLAEGFRFITLSSDARALAVQAKSWVDGARAVAQKHGVAAR